MEICEQVVFSLKNKEKRKGMQDDDTLLNYLKDKKSRFFLTALPTLCLPNYSFPFNLYQKQPPRDELVLLTQNKLGCRYSCLLGHILQPRWGR